jgi:hypothetical protein
MNEALIRKSAILIASTTAGLLLTATVASAQDSPVSLGGQAQVPLNSFYVNPPSGSAALGGVTFDLSGGSFVYLPTGTAASFSASVKDATAVHLLLNTSYTWSWYQGMKIGAVQLQFADGSSQTADLISGQNIREWRIGAGPIVTTSLTDPAAQTVFTGDPVNGGGPAVIDMLTISMAGPKTLTGITVANTTWDALHIMLSGISATYRPARPGNSGNTPAADNSKAGSHSNSAIFTGESPSQGDSAASQSAGLNGQAQAEDRDRHGKGNGK